METHSKERKREKTEEGKVLSRQKLSQESGTGVWKDKGATENHRQRYSTHLDSLDPHCGSRPGSMEENV